MKQPVKERIQEVVKLMQYCIGDIDYLLANYEEQLVKEYVLYLLELHEAYGKELKELGQRLEAQKFFDHAYVNPKYKDSFNPERY